MFWSKLTRRDLRLLFHVQCCRKCGDEIDLTRGAAALNDHIDAPIDEELPDPAPM